MELKAIFKLKQAWDTFIGNHPKIQPFINGVREKGAEQGMEIAVAVRYPDGTEYKTGIRITGSDMETLRSLQSISPSDLQQ